MFYKLYNNESICYDITATDPTQEYVLEILQFTRGGITTAYKKQNGNHCTPAMDGGALRKCIDILTQNYSIPLDDIKRGRNIYCPLHENPKTSKTPSAKLNVKCGYFTCFSSNCTIPVNCKNGYRQLRATQLLKMLNKTK